MTGDKLYLNHMLGRCERLVGQDKADFRACVKAIALTDGLRDSFLEWMLR